MVVDNDDSCRQVEAMRILVGGESEETCWCQERKIGEFERESFDFFQESREKVFCELMINLGQNLIVAKPPKYYCSQILWREI